MSSVPTEVNCSFPDSLCFKYSNKSAKDGQFTAQGCISAELCRKLDNQKGLECCHGDLCNTGEAGKAQNPCSKELQFGCCAQYIKPYSVWPRVRLFWNRLATIMFIIKFKAHSGWLIKRALWEPKPGAKAVTPCQYSLFYVSCSPLLIFCALSASWVLYNRAKHNQSFFIC